MISRGSRPVLLRNPIFLWFFRGGGVQTPCPSLWIRPCDTSFIYLKSKVTLHFSAPNISILVLILSKLNIAMSSQHLPFHNSWQNSNDLGNLIFFQVTCDSLQWFIYNFGLMGPRTHSFQHQWVQLQTSESRTLFLMTSLQYYCILGLAEIKICIPETKLCTKDAGCAGNTITASAFIKAQN